LSGIFAVRLIGWRAAKIFSIIWWMTTFLTFVGTIVTIVTGAAFDGSQFSCESMYDYTDIQSCENALPIIYIVVNMIQFMFMIYGGVCANRFARLRKADHYLRKGQVDRHQLENRIQNTV
ncbi:hypothetical protein BGW38_005050, partial [Lunasporangiospora selenospora]